MRTQASSVKMPNEVQEVFGKPAGGESELSMTAPRLGSKPYYSITLCSITIIRPLSQ